MNVLVNLPNLLIIYTCLFFRGTSIQFDEKPANVIVNEDSSTDATGAESDCKEEEEEPEKESGNSEE